MNSKALRKGMLMSLIVGGLAASLWGQQDPKPAPDEGQTLLGPISCVVKITCDPMLLPITPESVLALVNSSYVAGEALKEAFDMPYPDPTVYQYQIEFKPLPGGIIVAPAGPMPVMGMSGGALPRPPREGGALGPPAEGGGGGGGGDRVRGGGGGFGAPAGGGSGGGAALEDGPRPGRPDAVPGGLMMPGAGGLPRAAGPGMLGPAAQPMTFGITVSAPPESSIVGQIEVMIHGFPPSRNEAFLRAVCERLQQALQGLWEKEMTSLNRRLQMSQDEEARATERLHELLNLRRELVESGQGDLMPEAVMDQIRRLDLERQRMEMDLLGQQARLKALQQQIQATGERILKESTDDAMIKPLQEKRELLREHLNRIAEQHKAGMTPESEVQKVRIAIAEAEAQLAEARRKVAQAGGSEILGKLNSELAMLAVTVAETEARLKHIREQMEKNRQLAGAADRYELEIAMAMPYARRAYETSKIRVEELEQRMRTAVAPTVTVIGGATSNPAK